MKNNSEQCEQDKFKGASKQKFLVQSINNKKYRLEVGVLL